METIRELAKQAGAKIMTKDGKHRIKWSNGAVTKLLSTKDCIYRLQVNLAFND